MLTQRRCGGSEEMWWLRGDVVAQRRCGDSEGMWWLILEEMALGEIWRFCCDVMVIGVMWWLSEDVVALMW